MQDHSQCEHAMQINPLKAKFLLNNISKLSSYLTENTIKIQPVSTVPGNNRCLL
jgi:hypothetical protein